MTEAVKDYSESLVVAPLLKLEMPFVGPTNTNGKSACSAYRKLLASVTPLSEYGMIAIIPTVLNRYLELELTTKSF